MKQWRLSRVLFSLEPHSSEEASEETGEEAIEEAIEEASEEPSEEASDATVLHSRLTSNHRCVLTAILHQIVYRDRSRTAQSKHLLCQKFMASGTWERLSLNAFFLPDNKFSPGAKPCEVGKLRPYLKSRGSRHHLSDMVP